MAGKVKQSEHFLQHYRAGKMWTIVLRFGWNLRYVRDTNYHRAFSRAQLELITHRITQ